MTMAAQRGMEVVVARPEGYEIPAPLADKARRLAAANGGSFTETTDRAAVGHLITMPESVDVIIPRGGKGLIERISAESRVPVIKHLDGNCHVYVDAEVDLDPHVLVDGFVGAPARNRVVIEGVLHLPGITARTDAPIGEPREFLARLHNAELADVPLVGAFRGLEQPQAANHLPGERERETAGGRKIREERAPDEFAEGAVCARLVGNQ